MERGAVVLDQTTNWCHAYPARDADRRRLCPSRIWRLWSNPRRAAPWCTGRWLMRQLWATRPHSSQSGLRITNNESAAVVVNTIALSFVPPPVVTPVAIAVNISVGSAETTLWNFATADNIFLPDPTPPTFTVSIWCNGFTDPKTIALALDPHSNPVTGGAYLFPARADDLSDGEFWQGISGKHSPAGGGVQLFGYDMGVVAYDGQNDTWAHLLPSGSNAKNEDYRVWGKPIYAMADGIVQSLGLTTSPRIPIRPQTCRRPTLSKATISTSSTVLS